MLDYRGWWSPSKVSFWLHKNHIYFHSRNPFQSPLKRCPLFSLLAHPTRTIDNANAPFITRRTIIHIHVQQFRRNLNANCHSFKTRSHGWGEEMKTIIKLCYFVLRGKHSMYQRFLQGEKLNSFNREQFVLHFFRHFYEHLSYDRTIKRCLALNDVFLNLRRAKNFPCLSHSQNNP